MAGNKRGPDSSCTDEVMQKALDYVNGGYKDLEQAIPTGAGLARHLGVVRKTLFNWRDYHEEFAFIMDSMNCEQEMSCINKGLKGDFNPQITKLILAKHGYHDKIDSNLTSSDGSMSPKDNSLAVLEALKRKHK